MISSVVYHLIVKYETIGAFIDMKQPRNDQKTTHKWKNVQYKLP